MVKSEYLNNGTLALVDIDETILDKMTTLAKMVVEETGVNLKIESSLNYRDVLKGADFVVLSFAKDSVYYRGIDCEVSEKYGVRMCSGDTIGPGGIFRALRELPVILDIAKDVEKICPNAWLINYINPTAVNGMALKRYFPKLKTFALCDGLHMPHVKRNYAIRAGLASSEKDYTKDIEAKFDFRIAGVNHFTWLIRAMYNGEDLSSDIARSLKIDVAKETDGLDTGAKAIFNNTIGYELYKAYGRIPTCVAHTKEYMRFWQGRNIADEAISKLNLWETEARYKRHQEMWDEVDGFINGKTPISDYMTTYKPDHATDIIESMVGNLGKQFFINTYNNGAVTNMSDDAFLELLCDVDMENGPVPIEVGDMPRGIRGMQELILDTHELTAEAIYKRDISLLRKAMLTDPLVCSIADADAIIKELMDAEKVMIPEAFYK